MKISKIQSNTTVKIFKNNEPPIIKSMKSESWADIRDLTENDASKIKQILNDWGFKEIRGLGEKEKIKKSDNVGFECSSDSEGPFISLFGGGNVNEMISLVKADMEEMCEGQQN